MKRTVSLILFLLSTLILLTSSSVFAQQKPFSQEGQCSYYADKFHGRSTASGERYDKTQFTCAHMTLPYGTNLKVTNLANGKNVVVRVNDRGPFSPNRIVDVSRAAAEALDMITAGVVKARIEITSEQPPAAAAATEKKSTDVQKSDAERGIEEYSPKKEPFLDSKPVPSPQVEESVATPPVVAKPAPSSTQSTPATPPAPIAPPVPEVQQKADLYSVQVAKRNVTGFAVQIASFNGVGNLLARMADFDESVKSNLFLLTVERDGVVSYKILYGTYATRPEAEKAKEAIVGKYPDCFIVTL